MIAVVDGFVYLGTSINKHRDELEDTKRRKVLASKT
jgi:hypothetical protein